MLKKTEIENIPVFDSLVHVTKDGKWFNTSHKATEERLLQQFVDYGGLKKALLVGMPGQDVNYLSSIARRYSDKFIPIAPFELGHDQDLKSYFNNLKMLGFKGIKIHPRFLNISLVDARIVEAIQWAKSFGMLSLVCTIHRYPSVPIMYPISEALYNICSQSKGAKIILLHGGYYDLLATSEMIRGFENVLLDLSTTLVRFQNTHLKETIKYLFETFDRRMCIGSDFPEHTINDVVRSIKNDILIKMRITQEKLENIFYKNLQNFL